MKAKYLTLFLIVVVPSLAPAVWLTDGLGNPLDYQGQPIPQRITDLSKYIRERTTLSQEQSQHVANVLYEVDKSLSMNDGHLAGNDPGLVNEDLVTWLLINRVGLVDEDVERLMVVTRLNQIPIILETPDSSSWPSEVSFVRQSRYMQQGDQRD